MKSLETQQEASALPTLCSGLACTASSTHRALQADNQDAAGVALLPEVGRTAVLVADGLGSFARAGEGARFAVRTAQSLLRGEEHDQRPLHSLSDLFPMVQERLERFSEEKDLQLPDANRAERNPKQSWGTTLLTAIDTPEALYTGYVGNGGLFHLRGNFAEYGDGTMPPWCCVNYLNPHTVCEEGREALYRYLAAEIAAGQAEPTLTTLGKDSRYGDLLLLCTDGVFSQDQVRCGDPGDGSLWNEVSAPLRAVLATLRTCFLDAEPMTEQSLGTALSACLNDLRERRMLDDDATIGLLVTGRALAYRQECQAARLLQETTLRPLEKVLA